MKHLTDNQVWVIDELRRQGCHFIAGETERHWKEGRRYYIDSRVGVKGIRLKFKQGNKEAEA